MIQYIEYFVPFIYILPMNRKILFSFLLVAVCSQQYFANINLDPNLVTSTNNAISNLHGLLSLYGCNGNQLFQHKDPYTSNFYNPRRYAFYSIILDVVNNLHSIKNAVNANNIIQGSGNIVRGNGNIVVGNRDIVNGNRLWVFSCSQNVNGNELLIIGNFQINLLNINSFMCNPAVVIRCLQANEFTDHFNVFGAKGNIPASISAAVNQIKLLI